MNWGKCRGNYMTKEEGSERCNPASFEGRRQKSWTKVCTCLLETIKGEELDSSLDLPKGMQACWFFFFFNFSSMRPLPNLWGTELQGNKFVVFRSPVHVWCMRRVLRAGALGWPWGMGWGGRWEGGLGWVTHVHPWLIHVNVKQNHYNIVISLQSK